MCSGLCSLTRLKTPLPLCTAWGAPRAWAAPATRVRGLVLPALVGRCCKLVHGRLPTASNLPSTPAPFSIQTVVYLLPHETSYVEFLKVRKIPLHEADDAGAAPLPDLQAAVQRQAETDRCAALC